jgi:hypothetical protein
MQFKKKSLLFLLSIAFTFSLNAINQEAGTTGFNFLKVIYSARASALGSAFSAMDKDADGMFFNPGCLVTLQEKQMKTTFMSYLVGYQGGSVSYGTKVNERTAYGFYLSYLQSDRIDKTNVTSTGDYAGTDGTFGSSDIVAGVVVSKLMSDMIQAGFALKYIRESIDVNSASGVAVDIGFQHQPVNQKVRVGVEVRNLGTQLTYFTDSKYHDKLPVVLSGGMKYIFQPNFQGMFEISKPVGQNIAILLGAEYQYNEQFVGRLGYKTNASDWKTGGTIAFLSGISAGLGFNWHELGLDYAFVSYGDLGSVNQISLRYRF